MPGMTMPFEVRSGKLLEGRVPGDLVRATLVVTDRDAYLRTLEPTGHAPVTEPITNPSPRVLMPGERVADVALVDETGASTGIADLRGYVIAVTFMYTRCPLPNFCPLMDRHFKAVQDRVGSDAQLKGQVRLLSVTLDPAYDTPAVLAKHAARLGADPAVWRFVTGPKERVRRFGGQFGVSTPGGEQDEIEIAHNLRTVVIDRQGRLRATLNGNEWTPPQLVDQLRNAY
jgi:protein SCO1